MKVIAILDVDDVNHWYNSPNREAFFGPRGVTTTAFRDPAGDGNTVALMIEAPDMETLQSQLATPEAAEAQISDGVRVASIRMFVDA